MECGFLLAASLTPDIVECFGNEPGDRKVLFFRKITQIEKDKLLGGQPRYQVLDMF